MTLQERETLRRLAVALAVEHVTSGSGAGRSEIVLTVAERFGHPRSTRHPATYGYCPIIDGERDVILAAYDAALPENAYGGAR